ncbi:MULTISPECIES: DNA cytosine methyltransferase [Gammaproteobacteria]|uniref:DNA cytosine methyltransferase n=1 Tax=Alcanivorax jadensis TaxID=64988 RepID=UPI002354105D|nr:DNA cytosine methyltransferase [Alcanivorax jadensis]
MTAYYNEIDPFAAQWLRELIREGHIAPGDVDERSIEDVRPDELAGYTQCHFFAGIGVWSLALRRAGWPDDRPVWTGSCPCQPFSAAGKGNGFDDERHLWPSFQWLIQQRRPPKVLGEQVAAKRTDPWFDLVQADLEAMGYAFGCVPFPSAGVGAPHLRDRAFWVGDSECEGLEGFAGDGNGGQQPGRISSQQGGSAAPAGSHGGLANSDSSRCAPRGEGRKALGYGPSAESDSCAGEMGGADPVPTNGFWADADWLFCRDGKWRPVEPALKQMADGLACAMVYLRDARNDKEKIEEVKDAAADDSRSEEILRAVRDGAAPETVWLQIGRQIGFYEATLLFAFLLEHAGKLGRFIDCATQGGSEACSKVLREVRKSGAPTRPSCGRKYTQQRPEKFADALSELPQAGALEVIRTLNGSPLVDGAPARVGRLRGYGNAINAKQAEIFIRTVMEAA